MSNAAPVTNLNIFTFTGHIIVLYVDGTTIEGEYITQDSYNIFLKTGAESIMIPRQQIRYIKGKNNQPPEPDTSQEVIGSKTSSHSAVAVDINSGVGSSILGQTEEDEDDGTLILVTDQAVPSISEDTEEANDDEDDENDGTLIIVPDMVPKTPSAEPAAIDNDATDMTVVLGDDLDLPPDIDTVAPGSETDGVTARLECIGGPHVGDSFALNTGITTIGRSSDNTIVLSSDKEVSRHHAIILFEQGKYAVQDQNSLNGTFVNDQQITSPYYLENGDTFLTGLSTFKYEEV